MINAETLGCGKQATPKVDIDYGSSSIYTKEDMDSAIKLIQPTFFSAAARKKCRHFA